MLRTPLTKIPYILSVSPYVYHVLIGSVFIFLLFLVVAKFLIRKNV